VRPFLLTEAGQRIKKMTMAKKKITLALQGGGSHGAFTWGVLEKLYETDVFDITGWCGTSAGAINAAIAACGYHKNGNAGAIDLLNKFWKRISLQGSISLIQPTFLDKMLSSGNMQFSPTYNMFTTLNNYISPYYWNPLNLNPLKVILTDLLDLDALKNSNVKMYACATNVKTGRAKIFDQYHISVDALLASACLPQLYQAVKIDKDYYWDGGFMGNPPLNPLIKGTDTSDILLVQINPWVIKKVPRRADEIQHRINELSFNASLMGDIRMIEFKNELLDKGYTMDGKLRKIRYHAICADNALEEFDVSSKSNVSWDFLCLLRNRGREYADRWLKNEGNAVGMETSAVFSESFQKEYAG
jgi:NTE family protein